MYGPAKKLSRVNANLQQAIAAAERIFEMLDTHTEVLEPPNAAPLAPRSAKFTDTQRDSLAQSAGREQFDPSYDVWFDTSLFPRTAQAPFTLRTFPTRFPDVRTKPLNVCDLSVYKQVNLSERVRLQIRVDAHNVGNFPWFSVLDNNGSNVTNPLFGHLRADIGNETRVVVGVMKVLF